MAVCRSSAYPHADIYGYEPPDILEYFGGPLAHVEATAASDVRSLIEYGNPRGEYFLLRRCCELTPPVRHSLVYELLEE